MRTELAGGSQRQFVVETQLEDPTMPRKQRFKPSRKPKPIPPSDDATMSRQEGGSAVQNENTPARENTPVREADSLAVTESRSS